MDMIYSVLPRPPETVGRGIRKDGVRKTARRAKTRRSADGKDEYAEASTSFLGTQKLMETQERDHDDEAQRNREEVTSNFADSTTKSAQEADVSAEHDDSVTLRANSQLEADLYSYPSSNASISIGLRSEDPTSIERPEQDEVAKTNTLNTSSLNQSTAPKFSTSTSTSTSTSASVSAKSSDSLGSKMPAHVVTQVTAKNQGPAKKTIEENSEEPKVELVELKAVEPKIKEKVNPQKLATKSQGPKLATEYGPGMKSCPTGLAPAVPHLEVEA